MKKIFLLSLFCFLSLCARENPFAPQIKSPDPIVIPPKIEPTPQVVNKPIEQAPIVIETKKIEIAKPVKIKSVKPIVKKPKKRPNIRKKTPKSILLYNGTFTKIKLVSNTIKIITKDKILKHFSLTYPNRLVIDFERFDVVLPFSRTIQSSRVKGLRVGHHDYFYRTSFKLRKNYRYKITNTSYGYLIKLY